MFKSDSITSSSSSGGSEFQISPFSLPFPKDYFSPSFPTTDKADFLYNKVLCNNNNAEFVARYYSDSIVSMILGYSGSNADRDIRNVLGGSARNLEWRVQQLEDDMKRRGMVYVDTGRNKNTKNKNNNDAIAAEASTLIEICRSASKEKNISDKIISEWLQFNGENAGRNIENVLVGKSKDLEWRVDSLREMMRSKGLLQRFNSDRSVNDDSQPQSQDRNDEKSEKQKQNELENLDDKPTATKHKKRLPCDLPVSFRPIVRKFTREDALKSGAFEDDEENINNSNNNDNDDDTPLPTDIELPVCPICLDVFSVGDDIAETVVCEHMFHKKCISNWFKQSNSPCCPFCGQRQLHVVSDENDDTDSESDTRQSKSSNNKEKKKSSSSSTNNNTKDPIKAVELSDLQMDKIWKDACQYQQQNKNKNGIAASDSAAGPSSSGGPRQNLPEQVGRGGSATIFKGLLHSIASFVPNNNNNRKNNNTTADEFIAIKVFDPSVDQTEFEKEVANLTSIHHPNIIQPLAFCRLPQWKCIIFPFLEPICVDYKVQPPRVLNLEDDHQRLAIIFDIALAVEYLHSDSTNSKKTQDKRRRSADKKSDTHNNNINHSKIAHRDIKINNCLLAPRTPQKCGILADLGSARKESNRTINNNNSKSKNNNNSTMTRIVGTDAYLDPALLEFAKNNNLNTVPSSMYFPADIYSLGITFAVLCWQQVPNTEEDRKLMLDNLETPFNLHNGGSFGKRAPGLIELIRKMTAAPQQTRPTASQVVETLKKIASESDSLSEQQKMQSGSLQRNRPLAEVLCQSCFHHFRDVAFEPCMHHVYCDECCQRRKKDAEMENNGDVSATFGCPFCNEPVRNLRHVSPDAPTKVVF